MQTTLSPSYQAYLSKSRSNSRWIFNFPLPIISIHFAQNWNSLIPSFQKPKNNRPLRDRFHFYLFSMAKSHFPFPPSLLSQDVLLRHLFCLSPVLNPFLELFLSVQSNAAASIQFHYCRRTVLRFHPRALRNSCELLSGTNYPRAVGMR